MATGAVEAIYKLKYLIFLSIKSTGKSQEYRENIGNFVLIGAWQPCFFVRCECSLAILSKLY